METEGGLSRERIVNGLKGISKLRIEITHATILTYSALALILFVAFTIRVLPMRWEIPTGSFHLSEFDPYFNYRFTQYIVNHGFLSWAWPTQWIDPQRWAPQGSNVPAGFFPGLPMAGAFFYDIIAGVGVNIQLMDFLALLAPIFSTMAVFALYFLGKEIGGKAVGLLAALFMALDPTHIERTGFGFYGDETVGILALVIFVLMFLRAIDENRPIKSVAIYGITGGLALGYFSASWGASYFPVGLATLFVFVLVLIRRYTPRLFLAYGLTFGLGLFLSASVPKNGLSYLTTFAILPVAGVFLVLFFSEVARNIGSLRWKVITIIVIAALLIAGFALMYQLGFMRSIAGKFLSVLNPFTRGAQPLIQSVAEHKLSAWGQMYYEYGIGILFFIVGFYFVLRNPTNKNIFLVVFGITSLYFAASMVRLFELFTPAYAVLAGIGITGILKPFITLIKEPPRISLKKKLGMEHVGREFSGATVLLIFLILMTSVAFPMPRVFRSAYVPVTITASSLPIAPAVPVRQWLDMLQWTRSNLNSGTVVCAWWDYGYWLTVMGNVTTLEDNATNNSTQIQNCGFAFMANETDAVKMLKTYNAEYILVFVTFDANGNYQDGGGGDNGKWTWMARISGTSDAQQRLINDGFITHQQSWTNETTFGGVPANSTTGKWDWNNAGRNSTIYQLMSWGKNQWCKAQSVADPDQGNVTLTFPLGTGPRYFEEAFFSGKTLSPTDAQNNYGSLVPLVCLYKIDYAKYNADHPGS
jgi:dolichyl-diphosphooligosaccharide--protein glycosyltransferase